MSNPFIYSVRAIYGFFILLNVLMMFWLNNWIAIVPFGVNVYIMVLWFKIELRDYRFKQKWGERP